MNNQKFQDSFDQRFYSNLLGSEAYISQLKEEAKSKNMHNRNQNVFSNYNQNNGFNSVSTSSPFASSLLIKDNDSLSQNQFKGNSLLNANTGLFGAGTQAGEFSNFANGNGNIETGITRERPVNAGHRYNSHSVGSLNFMSMYNNINNTGNTWRSPSLNASQDLTSLSTSLNRLDLNSNNNATANLLNAVAADRLSEMNSNFMDNTNDELSLATALGMNKKINSFSQGKIYL